MNYTRYLGISYKEGGRSFEAVDCYGVVYLIYRDALGIQLPDFQEREYQGQFSALWTPIEKEHLKEFDVILFRTSRTSEAINHIGLFTNDGRFIQCLENAGGVAIDRLDRPYWKKHYYRAFRYKDL